MTVGMNIVCIAVALASVAVLLVQAMSLFLSPSIRLCFSRCCSSTSQTEGPGLRDFFVL